MFKLFAAAASALLLCAPAFAVPVEIRLTGTIDPTVPPERAGEALHYTWGPDSTRFEREDGSLIDLNGERIEITIRYDTSARTPNNARSKGNGIEAWNVLPGSIEGSIPGIGAEFEYVTDIDEVTRFNEPNQPALFDHRSGKYKTFIRGTPGALRDYSPH